MAKKTIAIEMDSALHAELVKFAAKQFGHKAKVPDPNWKRSDEQPTRPMIDNPQTQEEFLVEKTKRDWERIIANGRAEEELEVKRQKQKEIKL